ncbi:diguanylate cyclase domain-containing protein [Sulfurivermis fontis]|uniref:diguanylate cyclase domain-containing protein n=1 Tax=Sulfurivermis fontis TaxID=1972068 RepID=UPI000FD7D4AF|nr:diguanylate cyclase [Sulfurivermis fontis]
MRKIVLQYRYWPLPILIWTLVVLVSFLWNQAQMEQKALQLANDRAQFVFKMVESVRLWNARHGGVYAPIDDYTQPNPYLDVPEREITTPSGTTLTMINPAYMTRQLTDVVAELSQLRLHLTSLKPLNPHNAPDAWERSQLEKFEHGVGEVSELVGQGEQAVFRFIAPLRVQQPCLKCHEHQGYRLGDIRGGVSVSFAAAPLLAPEAVQLRNIGLTHLAVWLLLSGLTLFALSRFRRQMLALESAKAQTECMVEQRTAELRAEVAERQQAEAQLRLFIESSGEGIIGMNLQGLCTLVNPEALRLLGMARPEQLLGRAVHELIHHSYADGRVHPVDECALHGTLRDGSVVHDDSDVFWRADGSRFPVEYRSHPLYNDGRLLGAVVTFSDITARKEAEAQLRKLSSAVEHSPAAAIITDSEGTIEYVNPRFVEMTGYQPEEVIGQNPRLWQSGMTPLKTYQRLWATIKGGEVWHGEVLNKAKDGHLFWENARISPIKNDAGVITHFVAVKEDITERKAQEEFIWRQAHFDGLTGLPNRELFAKRLEQALNQTDLSEAQAGLLYIDLDGFKQVNDSFGHAAGDTLLREVARRLLTCVRDSDTVARLGGDEFAMVLAQVHGVSGAQVVAQKVLQVLMQPFQLQEQSVTLSASVGIVFYPDDGATADELLRRADAAMYRAKEAGRNGYRFYKDPV